MDPTCIDSFLKALSELDERYSESALASGVRSQIKQLTRELEFLQFYIVFLGKWNEAMIRKHNHLGCIRKAHIKTRIRKAGRGLYVALLNLPDAEEIPQDWDISVSEMLAVIDTLKPEIKKNCLDMLDVQFEVKFSSRQLQKFDKCLSDSMSNLGTDCSAGDEKKLVESLKTKSHLLHTIFDFAERSLCNRKDLKAMRTLVQSWAHKAACLSILYWAVDGNDEQALCQFDPAALNLLLCTQSDISVFLGVFRSSRTPFSHRMLMGEAVSNLVDFLLENGPGKLSDNTSWNFRDETVFLIIFYSETPKSSKYAGEGNSLLEIAGELINDFVSFVSLNEFEVDVLLEKIRRLKASVKQIQMQAEEPVVVNYPSTNVCGFIDSMIESCMEMLRSDKSWVPFIRNQVVKMSEEMFSYRQIVKDHSGLQKREELKLLWTQVSNVAYKAKNAIISFLFMNDSPLWYNLMCFSDVVDEMKLIKIELMESLDKIKLIESESEVTKTLDEETLDDKTYQVEPQLHGVTGLKHAEDHIFDQLVRGSKGRWFVSIVGMPGVGKTTLAQRLYFHQTVRRRFHLCAWCSLSRTSTKREVLLAVLTEFGLSKEDMMRLHEQDLDHMIYKHLTHRRYLVVLDDIQDDAMLSKINHVLPDNFNGSRVLLTT